MVIHKTKHICSSLAVHFADFQSERFASEERQSKGNML